MTGPGRTPAPALAAALLIALAVPACADDEGETGEVLPSATRVEDTYDYRGELEAEIQGEVVEIRATQPAEQLRRGGSLWARVGPYILLFSEETRSLFEDFPGLEAVRVVTLTPEGDEVARAYLPRNALTEVTWRRSLNIAGRARRSGTDRPTLLEDLVRWGEDHTDFRYAPEFQSREEGGPEGAESLRQGAGRGDGVGPAPTQ